MCSVKQAGPRIQPKLLFLCYQNLCAEGRISQSVTEWNTPWLFSVEGLLELLRGLQERFRL